MTLSVYGFVTLSNFVLEYSELVLFHQFHYRDQSTLNQTLKIDLDVACLVSPHAGPEPRWEFSKECTRKKTYEKFRRKKTQKISAYFLRLVLFSFFLFLRIFQISQEVLWILSFVRSLFSFISSFFCMNSHLKRARNQRGIVEWSRQRLDLRIFRFNCLYEGQEVHIKKK